MISQDLLVAALVIASCNSKHISVVWLEGVSQPNCMCTAPNIDYLSATYANVI